MANIRVGSVAVYLEIMMRNFRFRRTSRINLTENDGLPFPNRHGLPKRDERTAKIPPQSWDCRAGRRPTRCSRSGANLALTACMGRRLG
jgi:hypothetical protein